MTLPVAIWLQCGPHAPPVGGVAVLGFPHGRGPLNPDAQQTPSEGDRSTARISPDRLSRRGTATVAAPSPGLIVATDRHPRAVTLEAPPYSRGAAPETDWRVGTLRPHEPRDGSHLGSGEARQREHARAGLGRNALKCYPNLLPHHSAPMIPFRAWAPKAAYLQAFRAMGRAGIEPATLGLRGPCSAG